MSFKTWNDRWKALKNSCENIGASDRWKDGENKPIKFIISPPADEKSICKIEMELKQKIPSSFRNIISKYSYKVDISWQLRASNDNPPFKGLFAGEIRWNLYNLQKLQQSYHKWLLDCFVNPNDPYDSVWYKKFPILEVGNGDIIAIELGDSNYNSIVYLSHDDGEGHGFVLGNSFEDYIDRLSMIGGVGAEDWQWIHFTSSKYSGIDGFSPSAIKWRDWFGLQITNIN